MNNLYIQIFYSIDNQLIGPKDEISIIISFYPNKQHLTVDDDFL